MNFIKNIFFLFKRFFNKEDNVKMIEIPLEKTKKSDKISFINSLKLNVIEKHSKKKVETQTCIGDGLGIQTKINF